MSDGQHENTHDENVLKLADLIKDIQIAMLTTMDEDGTLRSRPMATQQTPFDGTLYFFTDAGSPKVDEIGREHAVNVSYAAPDKNTYVSVSGTARVSRDRTRIDALWNPALKAWFPDGKNDPNIALLEVEVTKAEYWDQPHSAVVQAIGFVKALATGRRYEPGENEKIDL